ncbi:hypothetical protein EUA93_06880 [Nocardioides oleivorans]|uniref:Right handed beta helix domain-containing protein n=1 Tax=Nocardioides oleivorans TaxID=273676 RepID=A0A4Q2S188_9ACTN|nr:right-handed parallel beta-helix repeat-containing protein [Nocardioides oleivorans]RYB94094.1 hypothetical protein EUA93_06880 [Nocardioides oleivorans]
MRAGVLAATLLGLGVAAVVTSAAPAGASPAPAARVAAKADTVIGNGTPASCTSAKVVRAVAKGGTIAFSCGPDPVTIVMRRTAKVVNTSARVVLDGGGKVTLSGEGQRRILYMNTCDQAQVWTTSHCNDQPEPKLVVRRMSFADGNATDEAYRSDEGGGGGGAIFVRGGRFKIIDSTFVGNRCARTGPDVGGAAVRVFDQSQDKPVVVKRSTFTGGRCSNGSAISSIGVSWRISDSTFTDNKAVGRGANPARPGTPGGGSGGAIYLDGDDIHLTLTGSTITGNRAREGGGAIFFVSNDRSGTLTIEGSELTDNPSDGFETFPGIFFLGADHTFTDSVVR